MQQTVKRRGGRKKPAPKNADRTDYRKAMGKIGKVINRSIGNLSSELRKLNANKDVDGAAEVIGRGATLCVVAQVFEVLENLMNSEGPVPLDKLARVSRIVVDQRRVNQHVPTPGTPRAKSSVAEAKPVHDRKMLTTVVKEVYGVHLATDAEPADEGDPDDLRDDIGPDS